MGLSIRFHHFLFIATTASAGLTLQVTDSVSDPHGMRFKIIPGPVSRLLDTFEDEVLLGKICVTDYEEIVAILRELEMLPRRRRFDLRSMRMEPCRPDGTFYLASETPPLQCTEWMERLAMSALRAWGLLFFQ
jgi:hypothetical protein